MRYAPDELDPTTIRLPGHFPHFRDLQAGLIQLMRLKAQKNQSYVLAYHEVKPGEEPPEGGYGVREVPRAQFEEALYQCPQAWDADEAEPPRVPAILAAPTGEVVLAKPDLCEGCCHRLTRGVNGHCHGLQFDPLLP